MKILIVNTYDQGGAANACIRLHMGLLNQDLDSKLLLLHKTRDIEKSYQFQGQAFKPHPYLQFVYEILDKIGKKWDINFLKSKEKKKHLFLKKRLSGLESFTFPTSKYDITQSPLYQEADIINLHWVADFINVDTFFRKNKKPVVWTLHDMHPFTGGEHYMEWYESMNEKGYPSKRAIVQNENRWSKSILNKRKKVLKDIHNLTIVSPSNWLLKEAKNSDVFLASTFKLIPYGLNTEIFSSIDKNKAREALSLPNDKKIILFVAQSLSKRRKGMEYLQAYMNSLEDSDFLLCAVGEENAEGDSIENIIYLGTIEEGRMALAYNAADVFVIPSLMDNLPNTVLESLLCGTPVIGFPVGGIPDMIENGLNGLLTSEISVASLSNAVEEFFKEGVRYSKEEIRHNAVLKYESSLQVNSYVNLFQDLL